MDRGFGSNSDDSEFRRPPQPDTAAAVGQVDSASTPSSFGSGQLPPPSAPAAPTTGAAQPEWRFAPPAPSNVANVVAAGPAAAGPTGNMGAHQSQRSRRPVVIALVSLATVLVIAVALVGVLQGEGSEATAKPRFPRDPTRQYAVDIGASDDLDDVVIAGKSSRIAIVLVGFEHDELRVFDQAGAQLWQYRSDGALQVLTAGDDFLVIEDLNEEDARFVLLAGRTGDERWTTDIGWYDQVVVFDDSVLLSHDDEIEVFALSDGERLRSVPIDSVGDTDIDITVGLAMTGQFAVWVDDEVRVYDRRLQQVGATIPADGGDFASVLDGKVLVADDGELVRYGTDGKLQASDRFVVNWLVPVESSTWFYGNDDECGALEFSGDAVEVLWTIDTCDFRESARYRNGESYAVVLDEETIDDRWVDLSNGDVLRSTPGYIELTADGVFESNDDRFEAFQNDGGTRIYSQRRAGDQYMYLVDDALVMIDIGGRTAELTVFS